MRMVMMNSREYYEKIRNKAIKQVENGVFGTFNGVADMLRYTLQEALRQCGTNYPCRDYWMNRRREITGRGGEA